MKRQEERQRKEGDDKTIIPASRVLFYVSGPNLYGQLRG